jgi:hypothetical protein
MPQKRQMATSGRGSGVVGYNVQFAVETEHHLIVAHEVSNVGSDRSQLATMTKEAKAPAPRHRERAMSRMLHRRAPRPRRPHGKTRCADS